MPRLTNAELREMLAHPRQKMPAKTAVQEHLGRCDDGDQGCHTCMAFGCCDNTNPILDSLAELVEENEAMRNALGIKVADDWREALEILADK